MPIVAGPSSTGSLPGWAPGLDRVANYVPGRTLVAQTLTGSNVEAMTFDSTTRPTSTQVSALVEDAVAWVYTATGPVIDATLWPTATAAAAMYAAASVEYGYPERETANRKDALTTGDDLSKRATDMLTRLAARNDVRAGVDPDVFEVAPVWSFPRAPIYGDFPIY